MSSDNDPTPDEAPDEIIDADEPQDAPAGDDELIDAGEHYIPEDATANPEESDVETFDDDEGDEEGGERDGV